MLRLALCLLTIHAIAFPTPALAYLDPGTGSIILQGMLAAFVAVGVYFRVVRTYIANLFSRKPAPQASDAERTASKK